MPVTQGDAQRVYIPRKGMNSYLDTPGVKWNLFFLCLIQLTIQFQSSV